MHHPFLFISHDDGYDHIGIIKKIEGQNNKYCLINNPDSFDSVTELVEHYHHFPVKGPKFEQKLTTPVSIKVYISNLLFLFSIFSSPIYFSSLLSH